MGTSFSQFLLSVLYGTKRKKFGTYIYSLYYVSCIGTFFLKNQVIAPVIWAEIMKFIEYLIHLTNSIWTINIAQQSAKRLRKKRPTKIGWYRSEKSVAILQVEKQRNVKK